MAKNFLRNYPAQLYLSLAPAGISLYLVSHNIRNYDILNKVMVWRSKEPVPDSLIETLDTEFTTMATQKKKRFRNVNFTVSLIDNLEARTYGSFHLETGVEFQVPVISTIKSVDELKTRYPNLLNLVKELKLKGSVDTSSLSEKDLKHILLTEPVDTSSLSEKDIKHILLTERARQFFIRREITIAESISHLVVPSIIGGCGVFFGYPIFKTAASVIGGYPALFVVGTIALFCTYYIVTTEVRSRIIATDRRILLEDEAMVQGAVEYLHSRLAFGKLVHQNGNDGSKYFDHEGNCLKQNIKYTERLKQIQQFTADEQKKPSINVRAL
uniref:Uncharacterized protein n=1 Tax=Panagrolaimus sp. PS1159 TaxID=55785 RepID=A0AC35G3H1_9BILA